MKRLQNIHPALVLKEEFLAPLNISADTAIRFSKFFGTSPQFWLGLQNDFDLEEEILKKKKEFNENKDEIFIKSIIHKFVTGKLVEK